MATFSKMNIALTATAGPLLSTFQRVERRIGTFGKVTSGALGALGASFATAGAAALGFAGIQGLRAVITSAEDFNKAMANSLAIMSNVTAALRTDMVSAAQTVAESTRFSATEAAESYFFLASAGLDAAQSIAALPAVAQFAQAGNFDLALATDLATDAQSALGLTVKDTQQNLKNLTRVTDVLIKANTLANASAEQFSKALTTKAGTAAKGLGKDVEEVVAILAALADRGVKAEEAGNAVSIIFRDMSTKALQNAAAFKQLNINVFDSAGEFRNIADVIADMEKALAGMSDATRKATLLNLGFADKSIPFIQAVLGASDQIRGYEEKLRSAGGITEEVASKQIPEFTKSVNQLMASLAELGRNLFDIIDGPLGLLIDTFKQISKAVNSVVIEPVAAAFTGTAELIEDAAESIVKSVDKMINAQNKIPRPELLTELGVGVPLKFGGQDRELFDIQGAKRRLDRLRGRGTVELPFEAPGIAAIATQFEKGEISATAFSQALSKIQSPQLQMLRDDLAANEIGFMSFQDRVGQLAAELKTIPVLPPLFEEEPTILLIDEMVRGVITVEQFNTAMQKNSEILKQNAIAQKTAAEQAKRAQDIKPFLIELEFAKGIPKLRGDELRRQIAEEDRLARKQEDSLKPKLPPLPDFQAIERNRISQNFEAIAESMVSPIDKAQKEIEDIFSAIDQGLHPGLFADDAKEIARKRIQEILKGVKGDKVVPELFDLAAIDERLQRAVLDKKDPIPQQQLDKLTNIEKELQKRGLVFTGP